MNKEKLKHLPFNLLWHLPMLFGIVVFLLFYTSDWSLIILISTYVYLTTVKNSMLEDYYDEQLKQLNK